MSMQTPLHELPLHLRAYKLLNRFLESFLPESLYSRSLIIVIAPMVLLQTIMTGVIMQRHWESVTKSLSMATAREVALVTALYDASPKTPEAISELTARVNRTLDADFAVREGGLPPLPRNFFSLSDVKLTEYLSSRVARPLVVNTAGQYSEVFVALGNNRVLTLRTETSRISASSTPIFLMWLVGSSLALLAVAIIFLRNQIRPILELAQAAQSFGMGREVPDFVPRGAREVKAAAVAFMKMKGRIERHVEQRTAMLAGVSHDLRTILTRFKLELAFLGDDPRVKELKQDVDEMQRMLEGYMAFVKGDGGERGESTDVSALLAAVAATAGRSGVEIITDVPPDLTATVKPDALKRCIANLIANAQRFGHHVRLSAEITAQRLIITVEDDGPGIPAEMREEVFKPFVRLDDARNLDESGTGLGLAIAKDIARAHGGDVTLGDSSLGGLLARVNIPV